MFRHLIAAVDGSDSSLKALDRAINLAAHVGATLDVVSVEEELPRYVSKQVEASDERSEAERYFGKLHADATLRAVQHGVSVTTRILVGHEVQALLNDVRDQHADLLVVGATGHSGVWDVFLGSTADKLVAHAPTSVLVVHPADTGRAFKELVIGLDGSPLGERALTVALELGRLCDGTVRALSVVEGTPATGPANGQTSESYLESVQGKARSAAEAAGVHLEVDTRHGHAAKALVAYADDVDADLIVIGATGHERPWSPTAGGTARRVANEARCAVLLVRPPLLSHRVGDVMSRHVTTVTPDTPLRTVVDQLIRRGVKALPVVDGERRILGIITGGDLLRRGKLGVRLSLHGTLDQAELTAQVKQLESSGRTARSVMTTNPWTVTADASLDEAIHALVRHGIKRLPVVEDGGRLVGIVSRTDLLRALAADHPVAPPGIPTVALAHRVGDVAMPGVSTVAPTASAEEVLTAILASPFRRVVVTDANRHVLGIITDREVLARGDPANRPSLFDRLAGRTSTISGLISGPVTAASLMDRDVFTIPAEATVADAVQQFLALRVKRLVVVDADRRLVGILDRRAVLGSLVGTSATGSDLASPPNSAPGSTA
jgi:CBS domain-containing protein